MDLDLVLEYPEFEVIVRTRGSDILVAGVFPADDGTWDIVLGTSDEKAASVAKGLLVDVSGAIASASWEPVPELPTSGQPPFTSSDMNDFPF